MADIKWIKICTDIFNDEKLLLIEGMPEGDSLIVIWFKLLCMAGKQNNGGVFVINDKLAYTDEMLATIFRRPLNTVRLALATFEQYGMVEIVEGAITIPNWEKHQSLDKMEKLKEQNRQRVAAHREKQKLLAQKSGCNENCNITSNVTVTECNAIDIDKEEDKEIDKDNTKKKERKKNAPASFDSLIDTYSKGNTEIKELLGEWLKVRKAKRAAMTDRAIELNLQKLDKLAEESNMTVTEYLKEVICRGWNAFYPINDYSKGKTQPKPRYGNFDVNDAFNRAVRRTYTEAEMHQSDKDAKTVADDEELKARAARLQAMLEN